MKKFIVLALALASFCSFASPESDKCVAKVSKAASKLAEIELAAKNVNAFISFKQDVTAGTFFADVRTLDAAKKIEYTIQTADSGASKCIITKITLD